MSERNFEYTIGFSEKNVGRVTSEINSKCKDVRSLTDDCESCQNEMSAFTTHVKRVVLRCVRVVIYTSHMLISHPEPVQIHSSVTLLVPSINSNSKVNECC